MGITRLGSAAAHGTLSMEGLHPDWNGRYIVAWRDGENQLYLTPVDDDGQSRWLKPQTIEQED